MRSPRFISGFCFIIIGMAIGAGISFLQLRQLEARVNSFTAVVAPSQYSGVRRSLETKEPQDFVSKFSPELSSILLRDYSTIDNDYKSIFQSQILNSVTKEKSSEFRFITTSLLMICLLLLSASVVRKTKVATA